jgi:hypothetical protein
MDFWADPLARPIMMRLTEQLLQKGANVRARQSAHTHVNPLPLSCSGARSSALCDCAALGGHHALLE